MAGAEGLRVLIVDDNHSFLTVMPLLLHDAGVRDTTTAADLDELDERLEQLREGDDCGFDVALVDGWIPPDTGMDGGQKAIARIQAAGFMGPILGISDRQDEKLTGDNVRNIGKEHTVIVAEVGKLGTRWAA